MSAAIACVAVVACGNSEGTGSNPDGAASGGTVGAGGALASGGAGGGGGTGGQSVTDAGGGPTGGSPSSGGTPSASGGGVSDAGPPEDGGAHDIDLDLGGMNDDLPAPARDCIPGDTPFTGCIAYTGEYNGTPFEITCEYAVLAYVYFDRSRRIGCEMEIETDDVFRISFAFTDDLVGDVPGGFELVLPPDASSLGFIGVNRPTRNLESYFAGEDQLAETHDQAFRAAAHTDYVPGQFQGQTSERARGTFAATLEPKATCVPDAEGFGCDRIRLRGNFHVRSIPNMAILQ